MLASVPELASLSLTWSETPEDTFSHYEAYGRYLRKYFMECIYMPGLTEELLTMHQSSPLIWSVFSVTARFLSRWTVVEVRLREAIFAIKSNLLNFYFLAFCFRKMEKSYHVFCKSITEKICKLWHFHNWNWLCKCMPSDGFCENITFNTHCFT